MQGVGAHTSAGAFFSPDYDIKNPLDGNGLGENTYKLGRYERLAGTACFGRTRLHQRAQ